MAYQSYYTGLDYVDGTSPAISSDQLAPQHALDATPSNNSPPQPSFGDTIGGAYRTQPSLYASYAFDHFNGIQEPVENIELSSNGCDSLNYRAPGRSAGHSDMAPLSAVSQRAPTSTGDSRGTNNYFDSFSIKRLYDVSSMATTDRGSPSNAVNNGLASQYSGSVPTPQGIPISAVTNESRITDHNSQMSPFPAEHTFSAPAANGTQSTPRAGNLRQVTKITLPSDALVPSFSLYDSSQLAWHHQPGLHPHSNTRGATRTPMHPPMDTIRQPLGDKTTGYSEQESVGFISRIARSNLRFEPYYRPSTPMPSWRGNWHSTMPVISSSPVSADPSEALASTIKYSPPAHSPAQEIQTWKLAPHNHIHRSILLALFDTCGIISGCLEPIHGSPEAEIILAIAGRYAGCLIPTTIRETGRSIYMKFVDENNKCLLSYDYGSKTSSKTTIGSKTTIDRAIENVRTALQHRAFICTWNDCKVCKDTREAFFAYERLKDHMTRAQPVICKCGSIYRMDNKSRHKCGNN